MSLELTHNKKYLIAAWICLLVGLVLAADGLLQLVGGNMDRMGEASLGGALAMISSVLFLMSRPKKAKLEDQPAK